MNQGQERKLWGIVLAAGEGAQGRDFLTRPCGWRGVALICAVSGLHSPRRRCRGRV